MAEQRMKGLCNDLAGDNLKRLILGITNTEVVNTSAGDVTPTMTNCRAISVDVDGTMKLSYTDDFGEVVTTEVKSMKAGVMYPYRNVVKVFQYYTGTSAVATVYQIAEDGTASLVNGLKLHR